MTDNQEKDLPCVTTSACLAASWATPCASRKGDAVFAVVSNDPPDLGPLRPRPGPGGAQRTGADSQRAAARNDDRRRAPFPISCISPTLPRTSTTSVVAAPTTWPVRSREKAA